MDKTRLGPYAIRDKLGEGGMGEVYLADDTRLGRQVAIKVLPGEFASDPDRLVRFEREARAAAALNHPHIAAIHDVGTDDGVHYMVQEYLEGQTLGDEIASRRMSLERALELGIEMAEALGAAHAAGIIHRDLKPANVFVTEQGHAKILDFGLAKLMDLTPIGGADADQTRSPTMLGTVAGQVMGTAGYMAPEQVEGGEIDARADLFAFGCLLYEMLTGSRPFAGRSIMQTLDMIVNEEPAPLPEVRAGMPAKLQWVLAKCLAKEPMRRYQDAEDLVVDLRWIASAAPEDTTNPVASATAPHGAARSGVPLPVAAVVCLVWVLATIWLVSGSRGVSGEAEAPLMNLGFALPPEVSFASLGRHAVTISRDGTVVAFSAADQVWIRRLGDTVAVPVRGTERGGRAAAFAPDGQHLVFWRAGEIRRVPVTGGTSLAIASAENPWGMRWQEDGWILYGQGTQGIWRVPSGGGAVEQVLALPEGDAAHGPQSLSGDRVLYTRRPSGVALWDDAEIVVQAPGEDEPQVLVRGGRDGRWVQQTFLVYARGADVFVRRWDGTQGHDPGPAVPVNTGVQSGREITGAAQFDLSDSGTFVFIAGDIGVAQGRQVLWRDRQGVSRLAPIEPLPMTRMAMSSSGTRVAVQVEDNSGAEIWVYDLDSGAGTRLTSGGFHGAPLWSRDDRWIYYSDVRHQGDFGDVLRVPADGSGSAEVVLAAGSDAAYRAESVADGGRVLVLDKFRIEDTRRTVDVVLYDTERGEFEAVADQIEFEYNGRLSPDGRYVAYARQVGSSSPRAQLQIRDLETRATFAVSAQDARDVRWSTDGTELFYVRSLGNRSDVMMSVPVMAVSPIRLGTPVELFELDADIAGEGDFWVSADGQDFLYATLPARLVSDPQEEVFVVVNWLRSLQERVPE